MRMQDMWRCRNYPVEGSSVPAVALRIKGSIQLPALQQCAPDQRPARTSRVRQLSQAMSTDSWSPG